MTQVTIEQALQQAIAHERAGRPGSAESIYRQVAAQSGDERAVYRLALLLMRANHPQAVELLRKLVVAHPDSAGFHSDLGLALQGQGRLDEAIASLRNAVTIQPNFAEGFLNLANVLGAAGRAAEAVAACERAVELRPDMPEAHFNYGNALRTAERLDEATAAFRAAVKLRPDFAVAQSHLGNMLQRQGHSEEAVEHHRRAVELEPGNAGSIVNLGIALVDCGLLDEADAYTRRALAIAPEMPGVHMNLALIELLRGQFESGWREYEWRAQLPVVRAELAIRTRPQWDGSAAGPAGGTILLYAEQGIGDAIQFVRYVPRVVARRWRVIVQCHPELKRLFESARPGLGIDEIVVRGSGQPLPAFDVQASLLSMPFLLREPIPGLIGALPYIEAPADLVEGWETVFPPTDKLRVGLVWAGNPKHLADHNRSMPLAALAPLASAGVEFHSLQFGPAAAQAREAAAAGLVLIDHTDRIKDFADTAAFLTRLDLLIGVDTAAIHLASAMGRPAWVMVSSAPDFRWMLDRDDSPWYPSLRIFRASQRGKWDDVATRVAAELGQWAKGRR